MRKGMFDNFGEFEVTIRKDERALGRTVQVLRTMTRQMNPLTLSHFMPHRCHCTFRIFNSHKRDIALNSYPGYMSDLLPGTWKCRKASCC